MSGSEDSTQDRRRTSRIVVVLILFAVAVVAFFTGLRKEDSGDVVSQFTPGIPSRARNGSIYWWENPGGRIILFSISLRSGTMSRIADVSQGRRLATRLRAVGEYLYFTDAERPLTGFYGTTAEIPPTDRSLGNFLHGAPHIGERIPGIFPTMRGEPGRLKRVRFEDGGVDALKVDTDGIPLQFLEYCVEGEYLYWRKSGSRSKVTVNRGSGSWVELPADCRLMASRFDGGPPQEVAAGLTESSALTSEEGFVFWTVPRPFPRIEQEMHYLRTSDGKTGKIPGYKVGGSIVPFMGKLYWASDDGTGLAESINHLDPDSGLARSIVRLQGWWLAASAHDAIRRKDDRLYTILFERQNPEKYSHGTNWLGFRRPISGRNLIVRVDPEKPQDLKDFRELPAKHEFTFWLDGDHVYYPVGTVKQSLLDLAFASSPGDLRRTLHRLPLP